MRSDVTAVISTGRKARKCDQGPIRFGKGQTEESGKSGIMAGNDTRLNPAPDWLNWQRRDWLESVAGMSKFWNFVGGWNFHGSTTGEERENG